MKTTRKREMRPFWHQRALPTTCLLLAAPGLAQEPKPVVPETGSAAAPATRDEATSFRLTQSLGNSVALAATPFRLQWSARNGHDAKDPAAVRSGEASGVVTADWLRFQGKADELLVATNGRVLMRSSDKWLAAPPNGRRKARPSPSSPRAMLQAIGSELPQILHREATILDDRPAEAFTLQMSSDQMRLLAPMFAHSEAGEFSGTGMDDILRGIFATAHPSAVIDVALTIDPSSKFVRRLQLRASVWPNGAGKLEQEVLAADGLPVRDAGDNPPAIVSQLDFRFDPDPKRDEPLLDARLRDQLGLRPDPREPQGNGR